jgi:hypothetical protein
MKSAAINANEIIGISILTNFETNRRVNGLWRAVMAYPLEMMKLLLMSLTDRISELCGIWRLSTTVAMLYR